MFLIGAGREWWGRWEECDHGSGSRIDIQAYSDEGSIDEAAAPGEPSNVIGDHSPHIGDFSRGCEGEGCGSRGMWRRRDKGTRAMGERGGAAPHSPDISEVSSEEQEQGNVLRQKLRKKGVTGHSHSPNISEASSGEEGGLWWQRRGMALSPEISDESSSDEVTLEMMGRGVVKSGVKPRGVRKDETRCTSKSRKRKITTYQSSPIHSDQVWIQSRV